MNKRLMKDFKAYLEEAAKTEINYGGYYPLAYQYRRKSREFLISLNGKNDDFIECGEDPKTYKDAGNIFFYEFSSMDKGCRHYNSISEFFKWAESCGITFSESVKREINYGNSIWVACIPYSTETVAKSSRKLLENFLSEYRDGVIAK